MRINGTGKANTLKGTAGNDNMIGKGGNDTLIGGGGLDVMKGGKGRDTFVISTDQFALIRDFKPGKDSIVFVDDVTDVGIGVAPLDPSDFGTLVTFSQGVLSHDGAPVVAVGDVPLSYADLFVN